MFNGYSVGVYLETADYGGLFRQKIVIYGKDVNRYDKWNVLKKDFMRLIEVITVNVADSLFGHLSQSATGLANKISATTTVDSKEIATISVNGKEGRWKKVKDFFKNLFKPK